MALPLHSVSITPKDAASAGICLLDENLAGRVIRDTKSFFSNSYCIE